MLTDRKDGSLVEAGHLPTVSALPRKDQDFGTSFWQAVWGQDTK
jgi:hypothetical protein